MGPHSGAALGIDGDGGEEGLKHQEMQANQ